ncbi:MAG: DUF4174 domain-containing protein [Chloroflexota bacterium]
MVMVSACAVNLTDGLMQVDDFRWQNRLIIIFTDEEDDQTIKEILLAEQLEVDDRHILWFVVSDGNVVTNYEGSIHFTFANGLKEQYASPDTLLEVVLIGKDGGVKYRANILDTAEIYARIDQMPMRQAEMRGQ